MKYLFDILKHKWFVLVAGFRVGGIPVWRLLIHDWSKFTPTEFIPYRKRFQLGKCSQDEWNKAWLNHIHHNPHHWEYWILNGVPLRMPDTYVREMVIDWLAAGRSYNGSWHIQSWLNQSFPKMQLHPESIEKLRLILDVQQLKLPY